MADRTSQAVIPAPVAEIVAAWNDRAAARFVAALAPDVVVRVPPLHMELHGVDEVWDGVTRLFAAFGALRYTSRHRYLSPQAVTDEVLLEGLQTHEFLGAPPSGQPGAVGARVMMQHDGRQVTSLTVWPDVTALRGLSSGMARHIDLRGGAGAASVVAALRATIPATEGKLSISTGQLPEVLVAENAGLLPGAPPAEPPPETKEAGGNRGKDGPKAPRTRRARRLRAVLAGVLMLGLAGGLTTFVVQGVRDTKDVVVATPKPRPTPTAVRKPTPKPSPSPSTTFDKRTNTFTLPDKVLFGLNEAELTPQARKGLDEVVTALTQEKRYGRIAISGYTDDTGSEAQNQLLSRRRALAVKIYLLERLPAGTNWTISAVGRGETNFLAPNTTEAGREKNRRVEIKVPEKRAG